MAKSLFENWAANTKGKDYLDTVLNCTRRRRTGTGHLGQRHLDYLKQYRNVTYTNLLTSGRPKRLPCRHQNRHRNALKGS